jgi:hypothetical protein
MNRDSRANFQTVLGLLRKMQDSYQRAQDGYTEENWDCLTLGYVLDQLTKVNRYSVMAIERINAELNGRMEGAPPLDAMPEDEIEPPY